jgi:hypothetical protein
MSELDPILEAFARKLAPLVAEAMREQDPKNPNELMTVPRIAKELTISPGKVRMLIRSKALKRVPDLKEMRVKRSVVDAFGTKP